MAAPATGVSWVNSGLGIFDGNRARRGGLVAVLVRDYGGASTDLSPGGVFGSPFAIDGTLRNDLLLNTPTSVSATNCGFWLIGAMSEAGVSRKPKVDVDKLMILQSNNTVRVDIQKEEKTISFTGYENKPLMDRLRFNKPLTTVEDVGLMNYFQGKPASGEFVERQLILIRSDKAGGAVELTAEPYPRVVLSDIGEAKMTKKDADAYELTWDSLLDPFFVDTGGVPLMDAVWRDGAGWRAGGGAPVFPAPAPVATAVTGLKANIVFNNVVSQSDPYVYTATKIVAGVPSAATISPTPVVGPTQTTVTITGLTNAVSYTATVTATGTNGISTTSLPSNTFVGLT